MKTYTQETILNLADKLFDPLNSDTSILAGKDELTIARHIAGLYLRDGQTTLLYWRGKWYHWDGRWREIDPDTFLDRLYREAKKYLVKWAVDAYRAEQKAYEALTDEEKEKAKEPKQVKAPALSRRVVNDIAMALRSIVSLGCQQAPCWLDQEVDGEWLSFADKLLNLTAWAGGKLEFIDQSPAYFDPNPLDYPLEYTEAEPTVLLAMLREQMNQSEIDSYQEFGGLAMTPITRFQKSYKAEGPPRSSKGTKDRVIKAVVGKHNVASKTLKNFNSPHVLEDLIGKNYLSLSDQRSSDKISAEALERLLQIVGEDEQNINPKGKSHYTAKLNCKIFIASNVPLDFSDDTGAAMSRFIFVKTRKSFVGREDTELFTKIMEQRNEVVWWFLRGLQRLLQNGRFTEPQNDLKIKFERLNAPVKSFIAERCDLSGEVGKDDLYNQFVEWCEEHQLPELDDTVFFRKLYDLNSAITAKRKRDNGRQINIVAGVSLKAA